VGARNAQQAASQRKAADIQLSPDQVQEIDAIGRLSLTIWTTTVMWK